VVLNLDPDRILCPKLDFFASLGVQPPRFTTTPILLTRSLDKHLVPCIQFLRGIVGTNRGVCRAIFLNPRSLAADLEKQMRPCVDTIRRLGLR
jgi:mTERF domain-containing protein